MDVPIWPVLTRDAVRPVTSVLFQQFTHPRPPHRTAGRTSDRRTGRHPRATVRLGDKRGQRRLVQARDPPGRCRRSLGREVHRSGAGVWGEQEDGHTPRRLTMRGTWLVTVARDGRGGGHGDGAGARGTRARSRRRLGRLLRRRPHPDLRQPGQLPHGDHHPVAGRPAVLRPGTSADLRLQPRRGHQVLHAKASARTRPARCAGGASPTRWDPTSTSRWTPGPCAPPGRRCSRP